MGTTSAKERRAATAEPNADARQRAATATSTSRLDAAPAERWLRRRVVGWSIITLAVGALGLLVASTVLLGDASVGGLPAEPTLGIAVGLYLSVRRLRRHLRSLRLVRATGLHLVALGQVRDNSTNLWFDRAYVLVRPSVLLDFDDDTNRTYLTRETNWPTRRRTQAVTTPGPYRVVWTGSRAVQLRDQYAPKRWRIPLRNARWKMHQPLGGRATHPAT